MTDSVKELVEAAKNVPMDRCAEHHHNRLRAAIARVEAEGDGKADEVLH